MSATESIAKPSVGMPMFRFTYFYHYWFSYQFGFYGC